MTRLTSRLSGLRSRAADDGAEGLSAASREMSPSEAASLTTLVRNAANVLGSNEALEPGAFAAA